MSHLMANIAYKQLSGDPNIPLSAGPKDMRGTVEGKVGARTESGLRQHLQLYSAGAKSLEDLTSHALVNYYVVTSTLLKGEAIHFLWPGSWQGNAVMNAHSGMLHEF